MVNKKKPPKGKTVLLKPKTKHYPEVNPKNHQKVNGCTYVHPRYPCRKAHAPGWQAWWGGEDLSWQRRPTWEIAKLGEILKRCQAMRTFQHRHDHFFSTIIILIKGDFNDLHDLRRQPSRSSLMSTFSQGVKDKFAVGFLFLFWSTFYTFCWLLTIFRVCCRQAFPRTQNRTNYVSWFENKSFLFVS